MKYISQFINLKVFGLFILILFKVHSQEPKTLFSYQISGEVREVNTNTPLDSAIVRFIIYPDSVDFTTISQGQYGGTWASIDHEFLVPNLYKVKQNYPNPFNPSTTIKYGILYDIFEIYDILGQKIIKNDLNKINSIKIKLSTGIYFYRFIDTESNHSIQKKMVLTDGGLVKIDLQRLTEPIFSNSKKLITASNSISKRDDIAQVKVFKEGYIKLDTTVFLHSEIMNIFNFTMQQIPAPVTVTFKPRDLLDDNEPILNIPMQLIVDNIVTQEIDIDTIITDSITFTLEQSDYDINLIDLDTLYYDHLLVIRKEGEFYNYMNPNFAQRDSYLNPTTNISIQENQTLNLYKIRKFQHEVTWAPAAGIYDGLEVLANSYEGRVARPITFVIDTTQEYAYGLSIPQAQIDEVLDIINNVFAQEIYDFPSYTVEYDTFQNHLHVTGERVVLWHNVWAPLHGEDIDPQTWEILSGTSVLAAGHPFNSPRAHKIEELIQPLYCSLDPFHTDIHHFFYDYIADTLTQYARYSTKIEAFTKLKTGFLPPQE